MGEVALEIFLKLPSFGLPLCPCFKRISRLLFSFLHALRRRIILIIKSAKHCIEDMQSLHSSPDFLFPHDIFS